MSHRFLALVFGCVVLCGAVMSYKVLALGYRLDTVSNDDRWSVQVTVRGQARGEKARLRLSLPGGSVDQVYDERFSYPGLKLSIKTRSRGRTALFTSDTDHPQGELTVVYHFSTHLARRSREDLPVTETAHFAADDTTASDTIPADDPDIRARAQELNPTAADDTARVRGLYDFVLDEIAPDEDPPDGARPEAALVAFSSHKGGPTARARLFVALVRSLHIPARVVHAVPLIEGTNRGLITRAEVLLNGQWIPIDPVHGHFGSDAEQGFVLSRSDGDLARAEGIENLQVSVAVARETINQYEAFQRRVHRGEKLLDWFSFYALPPRSQLVFRVLLLVPFGAVIVSVFRNLVGVPTFGTFIPILIALALRETRPLTGLLLLATVVGVGLFGREVLSRLRLLIVPRLSLLLTFVIFIMALIALLAARLDTTEGLSIALLPMVIMTMTVERLSVMLAEEGYRPALRTMAGTVLVGGVGYATIQSETLQHAVFTFPELNLLVVAMLLLLGRYTGYRLSERFRFASLLRKQEPRS